MKRLILFVTIVLSSGGVAAQEPQSPLPPEQAPPPTGVSPAVTFLMREYGISEVEAKERLAVQSELMELTGRLEREGDPGFRDTWIEHSPVFKVIIAFSDAKDRKALLESLPPRLRRYTQLRIVPRGRSQIKADQEAIERAFQATGVAFGGGFDTITGKYDIVVEDARSISTIRQALPATLRDDVAIRVGQLPKPEAAPTGVVAGDWIAGGYPLYPIKSDAQCTFGFPVRFKPTAQRPRSRASSLRDTAVMLRTTITTDIGSPLVRRWSRLRSPGNTTTRCLKLPVWRMIAATKYTIQTVPTSLEFLPGAITRFTLGPRRPAKAWETSFARVGSRPA